MSARESSVAQSMSSFNSIVRLDMDNMNMFSEDEVTRLITQLVDHFAKLQRANISHRNIKPANLVFRSKVGTSSRSVLSFEDLIVCNFENATCFSAT